MFDRLHIYQDYEVHPAALNMALDEALLEDSETPALRFYSWSRPTVSFGYFGKFEDAARAGIGCDVVRRWTGGGIVLHGNDLTYSLVLPTGEKCAVRSTRGVYWQLHAAMRDTLVEAGIAATLATSVSPKLSETCFANPVFADVLVKGRKIAGAAQRRARAGLLQQGSIQCRGLPDDFVLRFADKLCPRIEAGPLGRTIILRARDIAEQKYASPEWLKRL
jgi:lipoyl(octanoyl) transferase